MMHLCAPRKKLFSSLLLLVLLFIACIPGQQDPGSQNLNAGLLPSFPGCDQIVSHAAYTLCYSEADEQARWVAYSLTKEMCSTNAVKRKDKFMADPSVKTGSAEPSDYKNSGYDRGHLCPAGDMNWSEQTMEESFYMSNMSPQVHEFNAGIWEKLEQRVRKWAEQKGEIMVVDGGVLTPGLKKIGDKNKVSVPDYFYKIVFSAQPQLSAVAFVIANRNWSGTGKSYLDFSVTVDSVEKMTGIDFFPALDDAIENKMESTNALSSWNH